MQATRVGSHLRPATPRFARATPRIPASKLGRPARPEDSDSLASPARARPATDESALQIQQPGVKTVQIEGSTVSSPELVRAIGRGVVRYTIPMEAGAKVGSTTVRPDSNWVVYASVRDGKLVFSETRIAFEKADGSPQTLDGFGPMDLREIYITEDGRLMADVKCWFDKDITEKKFGVDRISDDAGDFIRLLAESGGTSTKSSDLRDATFAVERDGTAVSLRGVVPPKPATGRQRAEAASKEQAKSALKSEDLQYTILPAPDGTPPRLRAGWFNLNETTAVKFTDDNAIVQLEGTRYRSLSTFRGKIEGLRLGAPGSAVTVLGTGEIELASDILTGNDGRGFPRDDKPQRLQATIRAFELNDVTILKEGQGKANRIHIDRLSARSPDGAPIWLSVQPDGPGEDGSRVPPRLMLDLENVDVSGVEMSLQAKAGEQPVEVNLGRGTSLHLDRLVVDSETDTLELSARGALDVSTSRLALQREGLDVDLGELSLSGEADIEYANGHLKVTSDAATPLSGTARPKSVALAQSNLGPVRMRLGADATAQVALRELDVAPGQPLHVRAAARIQGELESAMLGRGEGARRLSGRVDIDVRDLSLTRGQLPDRLDATVQIAERGGARVNLVTRSDAADNGGPPGLPDTGMRLEIPIDAMDATETIDIEKLPGFLDPDLSVRVSDGTVLETDFALRDGRIDPAASRVTVSPAIDARVKILGAPLSLSIRGFEIRDNGDGTAWLFPVVDAGDLLRATEVIGNALDIPDAIGKGDGVPWADNRRKDLGKMLTERIFGAESFPLEVDALRALLAKRPPSEPVVLPGPLEDLIDGMLPGEPVR